MSDMKMKVIVTAFPSGYEGAREFVPDGDGGEIEMLHPDVFKLVSGDDIWRARLRVSTPIPNAFINILKATDARWHFDLPDDFSGELKF